MDFIDGLYPDDLSIKLTNLIIQHFWSHTGNWPNLHSAITFFCSICTSTRRSSSCWTWSKSRDKPPRGWTTSTPRTLSTAIWNQTTSFCTMTSESLSITKLYSLEDTNCKTMQPMMSCQCQCLNKCASAASLWRSVTLVLPRWSHDGPRLVNRLNNLQAPFSGWPRRWKDHHHHHHHHHYGCGGETVVFAIAVAVHT